MKVKRSFGRGVARHKDIQKRRGSCVRETERGEEKERKGNKEIDSQFIWRLNDH